MIGFSKLLLSGFLALNTMNAPIQYEEDEQSNYVEESYYASISVFERVGVVGDSYASGVYADGNTPHHYSLSWLQNIARRNNIIGTNYSRGGLSTRTWWTHEYGLAKLLSSKPDDLYLLCLGMNDSHADETGVPVGSVEDIGTDKDTFYANYARIIHAVQNHAPRAKLILFTLMNIEQRYQPYTDAVVELAKLFNIPCVNVMEDSFFTSDFYRQTRVDNHPTSTVYSGMALALERLISKCMVDHAAYFMDYATQDDFGYGTLVERIENLEKNQTLTNQMLEELLNQLKNGEVDQAISALETYTKKDVQ